MTTLGAISIAMSGFVIGTLYGLAHIQGVCTAITNPPPRGVWIAGAISAATLAWSLLA